jgi:predicted DNA-binding ribbon-helix-helix protein
MISKIQKRSVAIGGHKTSISLEAEFWDSMRGIAHIRRQTISDFLAEINAERNGGNLSSSIRVFVLNWYHQRRRTAPEKQEAA